MAELTLVRTITARLAFDGCIRFSHESPAANLPGCTVFRSVACGSDRAAVRSRASAALAWPDAPVDAWVQNATFLAGFEAARARAHYAAGNFADFGPPTQRRASIDAHQTAIGNRIPLAASTGRENSVGLTRLRAHFAVGASAIGNLVRIASQRAGLAPLEPGGCATAARAGSPHRQCDPPDFPCRRDESSHRALR